MKPASPPRPRRPRLAVRRRRATSRPGAAPPPPDRVEKLLDLDAVAVGWQQALTAAERALASSDRAFPAGELGSRRHALARERRATAELLEQVGRARGGGQLPWLAPRPLSPALLGLPRHVRGCLFDVEGVLTDGARLHAWAWEIVLDEFLERLGERVGWRPEPFRRADYREYLDGRPRLDGIDAFLSSRGISVPEGDPLDSADEETAHGLARRKGEVLARGLVPHGVTALAGARRYLQAAGQAGLKRAAVSASSSTRPMLRLAGLDPLVDARVDADVMAAGRLRPRPAPDLLLAACRLLDLAPEETVTLTHSVAGVAAGHAAGLVVVGLGAGVERDALAGHDDLVVPSLATLLDPSLTADR